MHWKNIRKIPIGVINDLCTVQLLPERCWACSACTYNMQMILGRFECLTNVIYLMIGGLPIRR